MGKTLHEHQAQRGITPPRTFVLILGLTIAFLAAFVAVNVHDAPAASAQTTRYNLCDRTTVVRDEILLALQFPNRNLDEGKLGTINAKYAHWAQWDTATKSYKDVQCGVIPKLGPDGNPLLGSDGKPIPQTSPGDKPPDKAPTDAVAAGQLVTISVLDLGTDASWPTSSKSMRLTDKSLTQLVASDFVGLRNLVHLDISGNSISSIPDNFFVLNGVEVFRSTRGNAGLSPSWKWFGRDDAPKVKELEISNNGLKHSDIAQDAFSGFFDTSASTPDAASKLSTVKLRGQYMLGHINTNWFSPLTNLDRIEFNQSLVDTYFYAEGPTGTASIVRYASGAKTVVGAVDYPENTLANRDAIATAIRAEIDRYWQSSGGTGSATSATINAGNRVKGPKPGFNLCDPLDRQAWILPYIFSALQDPDNDPDTPAPELFSSIGCGTGETGYVEKGHLGSGARWVTESTGFDPSAPFITSLRRSDIKGLSIHYIKLTGTSIKSLPDGVFEGLSVRGFEMHNPGFQFNPKAWFGTSASAVTSLSFVGTGLTYRDIAFDHFDGFTNLQTLNLRQNLLGYVNTRWFQRLTKLNKLYLGESYVAKHFYDADGNDPDDASTQFQTGYWNSAELLSAITTVRTSYNSSSATVDYGATSGLRVPKIAVDICDRPKVMWAEIMRNQHLLNEVEGTRSGSYVTNVGDVRHAGYATVQANECIPVKGSWINITTFQQVDPETTTFDIDVHDKSIDVRNLYLYDSVGLGATLTGSHFENFFEVETVRLDRSGISSIPANTFRWAPNVRELSLSSNLLDDADFASPNFLAHFTKLRELNIDDNLLTSFSSSWLPTAARSGSAKPLRTLRLSSNPITSVDVSNLDLHALYMSETQVASLHASILTQVNMQTFWYQAPLLKLGGLHPEGSDAFLAALPLTITNSEPYKYIGNELQIEDRALDEAAVEFQLAHHARLKAINDATTRGNTVSAVTLYDPCRPDVWSLRSITDWADSSEVGNLCLTETQKRDWITSVGTFNRATWISAYNADLDDHLAEHLINSATGGPIERFIISGSPNAFGTGFDDSVLNRFGRQTCRWLWQMRIVGTDINFTQANSILQQLAGVYMPTRVLNPDGTTNYQQYYLSHLDFSYNPDLWVGATNERLDTFLLGVTPIKQGFGPFNLELAGTNLDYDTLKRILDSVAHYDDPPNNSQIIRSLNVSDNPNLWNRRSGSRWTRVSLQEMSAMVNRLQGLTSLDISDTGLSDTELRIIMSVLAINGSPSRNSGIKHSMARMASFAIADTDLSDMGTGALTTAFGRFTGRYPTAAPALRTLNLARTNIDCADLDAIADGLEAAGVLSTISNLNLDGNPRLFTDCGGVPVGPDTCDPGAMTEHPVVGLFKRFTNLRTISLNDAGIDFNELRCVAVGLDGADGTPADGSSMVRTVSLMNNPQAFTVPATTGTAAAKASGAQVVVVFRALPAARKVLVNTGFTTAQARAVLMDQQTGQTDEEQTETERRLDAQTPGLGTVTPLPTDLDLESGRGSLRVSFVHNPIVNNEPFNVLRYEYRYRVLPDDRDANWESTGTQAWRTASVDLTTTGAKSFFIYGLEPETVYQVELRASSLGRPSTVLLTGGTNIGTPVLTRILPTIREVSMRAGETVRLEVDTYGIANRLDNTIAAETDLVFTWSDSSSGGSFADPTNSRRVLYTAPGLPGRYTVTVQAQPDGICLSHHDSEFGISDAERLPCRAEFTIQVSRAPSDPDPDPDPINPAGAIPTSLNDASGTAYTVFTPVGGGMFTGTGITVSAEAGAIPDRQILGVSAAASSVQPPAAVPGATMTVSGGLYDINGVQQSGDPPVQGFRLDDPLTVCLPLPDAFRANVSDVVLVERKSDGSYGILSTKLRQSAGGLNVCGAVSALPSTVGVAKLGVIDAPPDPQPTATIGGPDAGATAPNASLLVVALGLGILLFAVVLGASLARAGPRERRVSQG